MLRKETSSRGRNYKLFLVLGVVSRGLSFYYSAKKESKCPCLEYFSLKALLWGSLSHIFNAVTNGQKYSFE